MVVGLRKLVRRIKVALQSESTKQWHEVEHDFLGCEYRTVRDRQMLELEAEDELLNKVPVRYVTDLHLHIRGDLEPHVRKSATSRRNLPRNLPNSFVNKEYIVWCRGHGFSMASPSLTLALCDGAIVRGDSCAW